MKCHRNGAHFNFFLQENQLLSLILQAIHGGTASLCSKYLILLFPPFPVRQPAPDQDNSGKQQQCRTLRHHRGQLNIHAGLKQANHNFEHEPYSTRHNASPYCQSM